MTEGDGTVLENGLGSGRPSPLAADEPLSLPLEGVISGPLPAGALWPMPGPLPARSANIDAGHSPRIGALPGSPGVRRTRRLRTSTLLARAQAAIPARMPDEFAQEIGPRQGRLRLNITLDADVADALRRVGVAENRTRAEVIRSLLITGLWTYERLLTLQPTEQDLAHALLEGKHS